MEKNQLQFYADTLKKIHVAILEQDEAYFTKQLTFFRSLIEEGKLNEFPKDIINKTVELFNRIGKMAEGQNISISDSEFDDLNTAYVNFEKSKEIS